MDGLLPLHDHGYEGLLKDRDNVTADSQTGTMMNPSDYMMVPNRDDYGHAYVWCYACDFRSMDLDVHAQLFG